MRPLPKNILGSLYQPASDSEQVSIDTGLIQERTGYVSSVTFYINIKIGKGKHGFGASFDFAETRDFETGKNVALFKKLSSGQINTKEIKNWIANMVLEQYHAGNVDRESISKKLSELIGVDEI